tara:strand:+ start:233 stop:442 length:210 start_codon:yes stop_codon:yes gene_type:complete
MLQKFNLNGQGRPQFWRSTMENIQKITMIGFVLIQIEEDIESEDFDKLEKLLMTVDYEILAKYASGEMR